jgi:hypothetical protein
MERQETGRPPTRPTAPASRALEAAEPEYVLWTHIGAESVFFYPPGSVEEHLVVEHGIPSVDMHWWAKGSYDHAGDHLQQWGVRLCAVGDLGNEEALIAITGSRLSWPAPGICLSGGGGV